MKTVLKIITTISLFFAICSCSTLESTANSRGSGSFRTYDQPYDKVFQAAVDAMRALPIEVVVIDKENGRVYGKTGLTIRSLGEYVAVFVTKNGPRNIKVEVISKRKTIASVLAENWEPKVLHQIDGRVND